jgi:hypothetical protein
LGIFDFRRKKKSGDAGAGAADASDEKRRRFEDILLAQDLEGARGKAVAYAYRRTKDLVADPDDSGPRHTLARRLVDDAIAIAWQRSSWDPAKGPILAVYLCSIIRSELSHDQEAAEGLEEAAQEAALDPSVPTGELPDPEVLVLAKEEEREDARAASSDIDWLRAFFRKKGDTVNLRWLELRAAGVDDEPAEMARRSPEHTPEDFYNAHKRRMRAVGRLLAHKAGGRDADEENG